MVFIGSLLNVDVLTNLGIRSLENKIPQVILMPNFSELGALDYFDNQKDLIFRINWNKMC